MMDQIIPENIKIRIKNFGPISNADLETNNFTIFIGPNNSGKSYAALLISALTHYSNNLHEKLKSSDFPYHDELFHSLEKNHKPHLEEIYDDVYRYVKENPHFEKDFLLNKKKINIIFKKAIWPFYSKVFSHELESMISSSDIEDLVMKNTNNFEVEYENIIIKNRKNSISLIKSNISAENVNLVGSVEENPINNPMILGKVRNGDFIFELNYSIFVSKIFSKNNADDSDYSKADFLCKLILANSEIMLINFLFSQNSYYMPVGKTEVMHNFLKIISHSLKNEDHGYAQSQKKLAGDIVDINKDLKRDFFDLATELENEIFKGEISIELDEDIPDVFYKREDSLKISTKQASFSIAELSPIILYLKHVLRSGDLLIIEEPESHLHPKNQEIFIKYLVKAMNNGLKVLITTHSDYILEKVNNCIRLNNITDEINKKKIMNNWNYDEDCLLDSDKINVYSFKNTGNYSFEAKKLNITKLGIEESDFEEINNKLYKESDDILDELLE